MHSPTKSSPREEKNNANEGEKDDGVCFNGTQLQTKLSLSSSCINHQKRNRQSDPEMEDTHISPISAQTQEKSGTVQNTVHLLPIADRVLELPSKTYEYDKVYELGDAQFDRCSVAKKPRDENNVDAPSNADISSTDIWNKEPTMTTDSVRKAIASEGTFEENSLDGTVGSKSVVEDYRLVSGRRIVTGVQWFWYGFRNCLGHKK